VILGEKRKNENDRTLLNLKDEMIVGRSGQNSPRRTRKPLNLHGFRGFEPHPHRQEIKGLCALNFADFRPSWVPVGIGSSLNWLFYSPHAQHVSGAGHLLNSGG
jgi:hypothetical protein